LKQGARAWLRFWLLEVRNRGELDAACAAQGFGRLGLQRSVVEDVVIGTAGSTPPPPPFPPKIAASSPPEQRKHRSDALPPGPGAWAHGNTRPNTPKTQAPPDDSDTPRAHQLRNPGYSADVDSDRVVYRHRSTASLRAPRPGRRDVTGCC
jgi:hypothetical protein